MTSLEKKARTYRPPETTTSEDLGCGWSIVINFGNKVLVAGCYYSGPKANDYYAAIYEHTTADKSCEGEIRLVTISDELFADNGHALHMGDEPLKVSKIV